MDSERNTFYVEPEKETRKDMLFRYSTEIFKLSVEVIRGKAISDFTEEEKNELKRFHDSEIIGDDIEFNDSLKALKMYYSSKKKNWREERIEYVLLENLIKQTTGFNTKKEFEESYLKEHKNDYRGCNEYIKKNYPDDYKRYNNKKETLQNKIQTNKNRLEDRCEQITKCRNKYYAHSVNPPIGKLYEWSQRLIDYLEVFMDDINLFEDYISDSTAHIVKINDYIQQLELFQSQCHGQAPSDDAVEFEFCKKRYSISNDIECDFSILLLDMLKEWEKGIDRVYYDNSDKIEEKQFEYMVQKYYANDSQKRLIYARKLDNLRRVEREDKDIIDALYLDLMNSIFPQSEDDKMDNIYWQGERYSESHFASIVLQSLIRHTNNNSLDAKKKMVINQITKLKEGRVSKYNSIRINIIEFCKAGVLSNYYGEKNDLIGKKLAEEFEKKLVYLWSEYEEKEDIEDVLFDDLTRKTIWKLIEHMKDGKVTYILPIIEKDRGLVIFESINELQEYIMDYIIHNSLEDSARMVQVIRNDNNYLYFAEREGLKV